MIETPSYTLVARLRNRDLGIIEYLGISPMGAPCWFDSPYDATVYLSRASAISAAAQLPSWTRAFHLSAPVETVRICAEKARCASETTPERAPAHVVAIEMRRRRPTGHSRRRRY